MTAASPTPTPRTRVGLRERKKIRTRQAIRRAAYRLFARQGYEATRVDEIAEAADVSPSTVFRYFPTKEDIVLTDDEDPVLEAALRARPSHEPPLTALREAIRETTRRLYGTPEALAEARQRMWLVATVPAIRRRMHESMARTGGVVAGVLTERLGRNAGDLEVRIFVGAVMGGLLEAMTHWVEYDTGEEGEEELPRLIDRALDVLEGGLADDA
jgi:AcrR family transcriptional regulator